MRVVGVCSGIGGMELASLWAGFRVVGPWHGLEAEPDSVAEAGDPRVDGVVRR